MSSAYKATVRLDEETEELTLTLDFGEGRVRELQRQRNEPLQRALYRVQVAASQYPDFSPKKEASEPDAKGKKKGKKDKKDELPHAELR